MRAREALKAQLIIVGLGLLIFNHPLKAEILTVYTYDAMNGRNSFGELLKKTFEKKNKVKLNLISFETEGEALNQIVIEGKNTRADILMGLDSSLAPRARATGLFAPIAVEFFRGVEEIASLGNDHLFLPFDYGFLAFIYDRNRMGKEIESFKSKNLRAFLESDLLKKRVVIADPRTSSLGFSFLRWTGGACKDQLELCWRRFLSKIVTISPGWTGSYGLFLQGEADWVLSYTTSRAYHLERENKDNYEFLSIADGHALQVEGAAVVKSSKKTALINSFLELLLSEDVQRQIPLTQWMYPAKKGISLPKSFQSLPIPKPFQLKAELSEDERRKLLAEWVQWTSRSK